MLQQEKPRACVHLSELQAYVRLETGDEEALAAGLLRTSTEMCERYIGAALMTRSFTEEIAAEPLGRRLSITPVRSVTAVHLLGEAVELSPERCSVVISADGEAEVSSAEAGTRLIVSGTAGLADDPNHVPEPIRQGIVRLAASLFSNRDSLLGDIPASVTMLWRPYKRLSVAR